MEPDLQPTVEEQLRGFVRPLRMQYTHTVCNETTTLSTYIAEAYALDPQRYLATYCAHCHDHCLVSEFLWVGTHMVVGS